MPAGNRIRANNVFGVTTNNPLTAGATAFNSLGLSLLPTVASAHAVVVLDPKRIFGEPEIVVVTAHTAAATVATITRGQYSTIARSHPLGTAWAHVPIDEDYREILTSSTRPSNPYEGQDIWETNTKRQAYYDGVSWWPGNGVVIATSGARPLTPFEGQEIYETDTDFTKIWNGSAWEQGLQIGAWTSFTPTLTQSGAVTKTVNYAKYIKIGRMVTASFDLGITGTGTAGNAVLIGLPLTRVTGGNPIIGSMLIYDSSTSTRYNGGAEISTSTTVALSYNQASPSSWGLVPNLALDSNDIIRATVTYETVT